MAKMPKANKEASAPPYLPFARFLESLDSIAACLPRQINRATWNSESSYTATLLANAYCFLGLTDAVGTPTAVLHRLISERASRAQILKDVLRTAYGETLDAVQNDESPQTVSDVLSRFRLSGTTHRKAVSFLVQACRYTGVALPLPADAKSRISHAKAKAGRTSLRDEATSMTVALRSGGEVTLAGRFNPFTISPDDRSFIFKLVDQLFAYQTDGQLTEETDSYMEDEAPF